MTSYERSVSLIRAVEYIEKDKIEGDIVECGVWKGGCKVNDARRKKASWIFQPKKRKDFFLF